MAQTIADRAEDDVTPNTILGKAISEIAETEAVAEIVELVLNEVSPDEQGRDWAAFGRMKAEIIQSAVERLKGEREQGEPHAGPLVAPRSIATVDFHTVLSALTAGGRLAAHEARQHGLKPAGRR